MTCSGHEWRVLSNSVSVVKTSFCHFICSPSSVRDTHAHIHTYIIHLFIYERKNYIYTPLCLCDNKFLSFPFRSGARAHPPHQHGHKHVHTYIYKYHTPSAWAHIYNYDILLFSFSHSLSRTIHTHTLSLTRIAVTHPSFYSPFILLSPSHTQVVTQSAQLSTSLLILFIHKNRSLFYCHFNFPIVTLPPTVIFF